LVNDVFFLGERDTREINRKDSRLVIQQPAGSDRPHENTAIANASSRNSVGGVRPENERLDFSPLDL